MTHTTTNQNSIATARTESYARIVHDRARVPRPLRALRRRTAGFLLVLLVLALASTAHAEGGTTQGTSLQGVAHHSARARGARAGYPVDVQSVGRSLDEQGERTMILDITSLCGDILDAPIHDLDVSVSVSMQLGPGGITGVRWHATLCVPIVMSGRSKFPYLHGPALK